MGGKTKVRWAEIQIGYESYIWGYEKRSAWKVKANGRSPPSLPFVKSICMPSPLGLGNLALRSANDRVCDDVLVGLSGATVLPTLGAHVGSALEEKAGVEGGVSSSSDDSDGESPHDVSETRDGVRDKMDGDSFLSAKRGPVDS